MNGRTAFDRFRNRNMSSMSPTTPAPRHALRAAKNRAEESAGTTKAATKAPPSGGVRSDEVGRDRVMIPKGGLKTITVPKDTHP